MQPIDIYRKLSFTLFNSKQRILILCANHSHRDKEVRKWLDILSRVFIQIDEREINIRSLIFYDDTRYRMEFSNGSVIQFDINGQ